MSDVDAMLDRQMESLQSDPYAELNGEIVHLMAMKAELQPAMDALKAQEKRVKELAGMVVEVGETHEAHGVKLSYRSGYERTSWDSKRLAGMVDMIPEIANARKVSQVKPSIVMKVS